MTQPSEVDTRLSELWALARQKPFQWDTALPRCASFLLSLQGKLLTGQETQIDQGRMLKRVFVEVVESAYKTIQANEGDDGPHYVLAAGALIGLITEEPEGYRRPTAITSRKRSVNKEVRHELAGQWLHPRKVRKNTDERECYGAFTRAFDAFLSGPDGLAVLGQTFTTEPPAQNTRPDTSRATRAPSPSSRHVVRARLEADVKSAIDRGTKILVFVGQAGMGKTHLAQHVAKERDRRDAPLIRFEAGIPAVASLQEAWISEGIESSPINADPISYLTMLCCGDKAPTTVIFDGLDDTKQLVKLLPNAPKSRIIGTCRLMTSALPDGGVVLSVRHMTLPEATSLVSVSGLDLRVNEARLIATALHGHPLAIMQVCDRLRKGRLLEIDNSPFEFSAIHGYELGNLHDRSESLSAALRDAVKSVREHNDLAFTVLELTVFGFFSSPSLATIGIMPRSLLFLYLKYNYPRKVSEFALDEAVHVLANHGLVTTKLVQVHGVSLQMNRLTRSVLRELLKDGDTGLVEGVNVLHENELGIPYEALFEMSDENASKVEMLRYLITEWIITINYSLHSFGRVDLQATRQEWDQKAGGPTLGSLGLVSRNSRSRKGVVLGFYPRMLTGWPSY